MKETVWPRNIFVDVNGQQVEFRRKQRWGRDLPADITNLVQAGQNEIKIVSLSYADSPSTFLARIEVVECCSEIEIKREIAHKSLLRTSDAKAQIVRRLKRGSGAADGDLIVSSSTVTVGLCCPLSFQRIGFPVRARACAHVECFDYDNYIASRPRKHPWVPPRDDAYKCPHCGARARPDDLIVDGFLATVLSAMRKEPDVYRDVKHIVVDEAGDWAAKRADTEDAAARRAASARAAEVICIDDD